MGQVTVKEYSEVVLFRDNFYFELDRLATIKDDTGKVDVETPGYEGTIDLDTGDDDIAPDAKMVVVNFDAEPLITTIRAAGPYEIVDHLMSVRRNADGLVQLVIVI
jgi:hypothetical protein